MQYTRVYTLGHHPARSIPVQVAVQLMFAFLVVCLATTAAGGDQDQAIEEIEKLGGTVRSIAQGTDEKEIAFHLSGTELTDEGLAWVPQVENVVWLNLRGTQITNDGLKHLAEMKSLRRLHVEKTEIGDDALDHLAELENLEYLNLYGTQVTDAGLPKLAKLTNLQKLYLWQTEATLTGARKLQQALPELDVNLGAEAQPGPPTRTLAHGQYVRVRLEGDERTLSLAEVEILETGTGAPLQTSATARQSSVASDGAAARAIDGNPDGDYSNDSVTHTEKETNPWWLVDLGEPKDIGRIVVHNRSDCCGERLEAARVEIFDGGLHVVWSGQVDNASDGSVTMFEAQEEDEEEEEEEEEEE